MTDDDQRFNPSLAPKTCEANASTSVKRYRPFSLSRDLRDYDQHRHRADTPESLLCPAGLRASFDRQLDLHGAVLVSAGIPNPERCFARRDLNFYLVAGNRCHCAVASTGHRRPHGLHHSGQAGAAFRIRAGKNRRSPFAAGDQHASHGGTPFCSCCTCASRPWCTRR